MSPNTLSLPMYVFAPEAVEVFAAGLIQHIARAGLEPPKFVVPSDPHSHWQDKHVLLSQACGYPLMHELQGKVQLVGTLGYKVEGASNWHARSIILLRKDKQLDRISTLEGLRGLRLAYNSPVSQSGFHALSRHLQKHVPHSPAQPHSQEHTTAHAFLSRFFTQLIETGSHQASMQALCDGKADVAALDCVTWAGLQKFQPNESRLLRVLAQTYPYPGLPLITSQTSSIDIIQTLQKCLFDVLNDPQLRHIHDTLFINAFYKTTLNDYQTIL